MASVHLSLGPTSGLPYVLEEQQEQNEMVLLCRQQGSSPQLQSSSKGAEGPGPPTLTEPSMPSYSFNEEASSAPAETAARRDGSTPYGDSLYLQETLNADVCVCGNGQGDDALHEEHRVCVQRASLKQIKKRIC